MSEFARLEDIRARCSQPIQEIVSSPREYYRVQQIMRDRRDLLEMVEKLLEACADSDEYGSGVLSTSFVRHVLASRANPLPEPK